MSASPSKVPPRKKIRCNLEEGPQLSSKPVLIRVGASKQEHYIHEILLRTNSIYVDNALKKEWKEGQDRVIELVDTDEIPFSIWVKWLYTGRVFLMKQDDLQKKGDKITGSYECVRWAACYALGDFLQDHDFKDAIIDCTIEATLHTRCYPHRLGSWIYPRSTTASAHRKLAVDVFVNRLGRGSWQRCAYSAEFLSDVIKTVAPNLEGGLRKQTIAEMFDLNNTCEYHDHGADKPCYKTKPAFRY